jgi:O-acetyl-ADP-ribose deacetylase
MAARIAVDAVRGADTQVDEARFVLFTPDALAAFEAAVG